MKSLFVSIAIVVIGIASPAHATLMDDMKQKWEAKGGVLGEAATKLEEEIPEDPERLEESPDPVPVQQTQAPAEVRTSSPRPRTQSANQAPGNLVEHANTVSPGLVQGPIQTVSSTAYCLTGRMASGRSVYWGAAAMNGVPLGSRYEVLSGPRAGMVFTIEDRIGHSSGFDIGMPGDCAAARQYGRRTIQIRRV